MPSLLTPAALLRLRDDPAAREEGSALAGGAAGLWVDLGSPAPAADWSWLGELPALGIGVLGGPPAPGCEALAAALDVIAASASEATEIAATLAAAPLASLVLAQLLRGSLARSIAEGLFAESLAYSTLQAGPEFAAWRSTRRAKPPARSGEPAVQVSREGAELRLRLDRPAKRNAFSAEMRDALCEALALALQDESVARVVLTGAGPSFCSGGDLDEFGTLPDPATAHAIRTTRSPAALLARCAARVEARVHGACVGAGVELPAFCARVVAARDAFFQLPEVGLGLVPGAGGTVSLPRRIGRQRTAWLALTRRRLPAEEALALGLVDALA